MEEKQKEIKTVSQEEIKLLTFQPQQMSDEIKKLKDELYSFTMDNGYLSMINVDLTEEVERLRKRSFRNLLQELLLRCLGGQWIEEK
jgi:diaminopimelate decarboxylase